jgi:hypothetical protein
MSKIPKPWTQSYANILNCCQTFLSSCCLIDPQIEPSKKTRILLHYTGEKKDGKSYPLPETKTFYPINVLKKSISKIPQTKFSSPNHNPTPINTDDLLKRLKLSHLFPELLKQTPPAIPNIRSMTASPKSMHPLEKDLENIPELLTDFDFERERDEIEDLKQLGEIERKLIAKYRPPEISRIEAKQISKINTTLQNTH